MTDNVEKFDGKIKELTHYKGISGHYVLINHYKVVGKNGAFFTCNSKVSDYTQYYGEDTAKEYLNQFNSTFSLESLSPKPLEPAQELRQQYC